MADFDPVIMIRNARIVDGSGTPWRKGLVRTGMDAVLVLFNPDTVRDGAAFEDPFGEPEGISHVFVAGKLAVKNGVFTGTTAGKVLRRS
ncbi:hypothetical protein [Aminivibrio sp.]|uniref:hypothetical protein n=1 Tax=Aminivibrio sp. TaxID=1872489 RepID=UPI001A49982C|nr:hypothetical protein [Aminivibrio sp.]MBL3540383.1 hypothetical protein [Aminivibrio sp.]